MLRTLAADLHESDTGDLLEALDPHLRPQLIELLGADFDFSALTEVDDTVREEILEELPAETVAEGVGDLDSDDAVYILEDLPKQEQAEILEQLPASDRVALERSLLYPEGSAGRRMQTEFIAVPPQRTVGETIDFMRETPDLPERFYEIYAVDPAQKFLGAVPLDRLLRTKRPVTIESLMDPDRRLVRATDDQEEVARQFERYDLVAAPVVDEADRLVGVMTVDDIVDVIEEEAEEDIKALGGVAKHEELSDSVWTIAKGRFPWLLANLVTALLASSVIAMFESLDPENGGARGADADRGQHGRQCRNADHDRRGARARHARPRATPIRCASRGAKFLVGLINGLGFAVIMGTVASFWFQTSDLGLVIGLAMICVLMAAAHRRLRHPGYSWKARHRSGGVIGAVRHHDDGHHRIFLLSGDRDARGSGLR